MFPVRDFYDAMAAGGLTIDGLDAALLGGVRALKAPYTPSLDMVIGDVTLANFVTSTNLTQSAQANVSIDPATGDRILVLKPPAGGWVWYVTAGTNLPQTIYGFILMNAALSGLVAVSEPLETPVELTAIGQYVDAGELSFRIPMGSVS